MNKGAKESRKKTLRTPGITPQTKIVNSGDLGTECWSCDRLVQSDCTQCDRHDACNYSVKGVYPNADPSKLYRTQLALLKLKQDIRKRIRKEQGR